MVGLQLVEYFSRPTALRIQKKLSNSLTVMSIYFGKCVSYITKQVINNVFWLFWNSSWTPLSPQTELEAGRMLWVVQKLSEIRKNFSKFPKDDVDVF